MNPSPELVFNTCLNLRVCSWLWCLPCTDCQWGCELLEVNSIPSGGSASSRGRWMRETERAPWGLRLNDFTAGGTHLDCLRMPLLHRQKPIFYYWQLFWWLLTGYFQPDVAKMRLCQPLTYEVCVLFFAIMKVNWMSWRISVCFLKLWETPFLTVLIYFRI